MPDASQQYDAEKARLDQLLNLRASGVAGVSTGDRSVRYQTGKELDDAIAQSQARLGRLDALLRRRPARVRQVVFVTGKGL